MTDIEILNKNLQKKFEEEQNYYNLERYVMSEILSPIEDYINAIDIIRNNINLNKGLNLYYIAAYLSAEWIPSSNEFLDTLNSMIDIVDDMDKAIIYYLNAYSLSWSMKNWRKCEKYRLYLLKSIQYSKKKHFVNNRFDLAKVLQGKDTLKYMNEAMENIEKVETIETLKNKSINYWLSSQRFIDEFILGTHLSQEVYLYKFNSIME